VARYIPKKGDFIALSFQPQSGHEQSGRRPALVVSNTLFNRHPGMAMVCPITTTDRGFPFHVAVPTSSSLTGFVMVEQFKSVDFSSRKAKFIEKAPQSLVDEVLGILDACLYDAA
jgi:mRNA interferase MazF